MHVDGHLALRRGLTHGPVAWVLLPLALAALCWYDRWKTQRGKRPEAQLPVRFGQLYLLALIACLTHPALDWLNSYGIRFLSPFSGRWFHGDALFIVDLWLWLGLGLATWLSMRREKPGRSAHAISRFAIFLAAFYAGANLLISESAEKNAEIDI